MPMQFWPAFWLTRDQDHCERMVGDEDKERTIRRA